MADERSADVDEGREQSAEAGRRPTIIAAAASRLTPVQEAWQEYVTHSLRQCGTCRAADGSPCQTAEDLYAAFQALAQAGMDRVAGREPLPRGQ